MFTDKKHSPQGLLSCALGISGLAAAFGSVARVHAAGGVVRTAQLASLGLGVIYGVVGLALGIWSLARGDSFRLFPLAGVALNILLLLALLGLFLLGVL